MLISIQFNVLNNQSFAFRYFSEVSEYFISKYLFICSDCVVWLRLQRGELQLLAPSLSLAWM